ncbi:hypothetical protein D9X30_2236 [Cupriavidus sp. U2]|nr:hypothetical protein D9X30_2236 [Cupriavidus sp. U2]
MGAAQKVGRTCGGVSEAGRRISTIRYTIFRIRRISRQYLCQGPMHRSKDAGPP